MTEQIKKEAEELVFTFYKPIMKRNYPDVAQMGLAKQCAIICCEKMIDDLSQYKGMHDQDFFDGLLNHYTQLKEYINANL